MKNVIGMVCCLLSAPAWSQNSLHLPEEKTVESGDFYVGTVFGDENYRDNANVSTSSFLMMKTQVPFKLYQEVYLWATQHGYSLGDGCNGASTEGCRSEGQDEGQHPTVNVTWWDTVLFANALSEQQGLAPYYLTTDGDTLKAAPESDDNAGIRRDSESAGYRLPDMVEWHVAARGGLAGLADGSYGHPHSGSSQPEAVANFPMQDGTVSGTLPVGSKRPNALGLYDMSGNVSEWLDERNHYAQGVSMYYFCGGSFQEAVTNLMAGCDVHSPSFAMPDMGFRLVRAIHD